MATATIPAQTQRRQIDMRLNRKCLNRFETIFNILLNSMRLRVLVPQVKKNFKLVNHPEEENNWKNLTRCCRSLSVPTIRTRCSFAVLYFHSSFIFIYTFASCFVTTSIVKGKRYIFFCVDFVSTAVKLNRKRFEKAKRPAVSRWNKILREN